MSCDWPEEVKHAPICIMVEAINQSGACILQVARWDVRKVQSAKVLLGWCLVIQLRIKGKKGKVLRM